MDSQQTPRDPAELAAGPKAPTDKQGPPIPVTSQNQPQPQGGPPGPRFPLANNGPTDGQPRFQHPGGPPPLRHLDSRSQLNPVPGPQGQFPPPRLPHGPPPPQRAPGPRNAFFGRPPQPGPQAPGGISPVRFLPGQSPPPGPQQQQQQFSGQPPLGARPPQPFSGQQGFPIRPPFPPAPGSGDPRGPGPNRGPPLQRNDSLGGGIRPNFPPDQRQQQQQQQQQRQPQQQINERKGQFRPQMSIDRMADVERSPSSASLRNEDAINRPKSAVSENGKSSDGENDNKKTTEEQLLTNNEATVIKTKSDNLEQQNNVKNIESMQKGAVISDAPGKTAGDQKTSVIESSAAATKVDEPKNSRPQSGLEKPKEAAVVVAATAVKPVPVAAAAVKPMPVSAAAVKPVPVTTAGNLQSAEVKTSLPELPTPPKTPSDSTTIKGFDDGQRRSLSSARYSPKSPASPAPSPVPTNEEIANATKKRTTFAEPETTKSDDGRLGSAERGPNSARTNKDNTARSTKPDAENDSGVDESTQRREAPKSNGITSSPTKKSRDTDKRSIAGSPIKSPSKSVKSLPRTPEAGTPSATPQDKKKVPMNKVQVGAAPSPNLKAVRSKIGSLENATYKPGGGKVKIENRKLDFSKAQPKIAAKNDKYTPSGGDKKIQQVKLQWNAKPKIGSLDNAAYKPGGGDKKIETVKLDFKDKAKPKVGSKENAKHVPGGGTIKSASTPPKTPQDNSDNIETQKLDIKAESKIGSMDNVKHKPGGGDKKIFDDKTYLRQTSSSNVGSVSGSGSQSPIPSGAGSITDKNGLPVSDENLNQEC